MAIARRLMLPMAFANIYPNLFILWLAPTTLYRKSTALTIAREIASEVFPFLLAAQDTTPEAFLSDLAGVQPVNYSDFSDKDKANWVMERNFSAQKGWVLDEASGLLANAGKDYNAGLMESLLRFYDCDPSFTRATKNQGRIIVNNAYLSLLGASTPSCMAGHFNHQRLWDNGWWPRFAILTPEGRPPYQEANGMRRPDDLTNRLQKLITRLPNSTKFPEPPQQFNSRHR